MKTISIEVEEEIEQEVMAAVNAIRAGRLLEHACRLSLPGNYIQAASEVHVEIGTSQQLRRRIVEDGRRDPVDAWKDAVTLLGLNSRRMEEVERAHAGTLAAIAG